LAPYPRENAAVRYRLLQYHTQLAEAGIDLAFSPFMGSAFFTRFYEPGHTLPKALYLMGSMLRRSVDVGRAAGYDAVLIHREAALAGPPVFEQLIARVMRKPVIFDFDDAVHLLDTSPVHRRVSRLLKCPAKTPKTLRLSRAVIAGNRYLAEYASTLNNNVTLIPTVVDASIVKPLRRGHNGREKRRVVLGWMGSHTNYPYLESLFPILRELAQSHDFTLRIVGAGREVALPGVKVENYRWSLATELDLLRSFDIGLYPIVDDAWARGKSGFKAIQYMAVGIPAVCSPVGVTTDIVREGVEGYLPPTREAWLDRLGALIGDAELRQSLGAAGRQRVENWYCAAQQAPRLQQVIEQAALQPQAARVVHCEGINKA
jgi:glycosyltransferase involved in cell wall biosynthesis